MNTNQFSLSTVLSDYQIREVIGKGTYSHVYRAQHKSTQRQYALKIIRLFGLCQFQIENNLREAIILKKCDHPNILKIYQCYLDTEEQILYIVLQYASNGDLLKKLETHKQTNQLFHQSIIWKLLSQLLQSLHYLHSLQILHRDIKPANVLIVGDSFKLGDFNISQIINTKSKGIMGGGTPNYLSPQRYKRQKQDESSDIWALGMLCYQICCLSNPNSCRQITEANTFFNGKSYNFSKIPNTYSTILSDCIQNILSSIEKRPKTQNIFSYLRGCGLSLQEKIDNPIQNPQTFFNELLNDNSKKIKNVFEQYEKFMSSVMTTKMSSQNTLLRTVRFDNQKSTNISQRKIKRLSKREKNKCEKQNI